MKRFYLLLSIALLVLLLAGCSEPPAPAATTAPPTNVTTTPPPTPEELYATARESVDLASNRVLTYSASLEQVLNNEHYTESTSGSASYSNYNRKGMTAIVEEQLSLGDNSYNYTEAYCEETAYVAVNDCYFQCDLTTQEFTKRQLPSILLDAALYDSLTLSEQFNSITLHFSEPSALESWIVAENAQLVSANGTAVLDSTGALIQTEYTCIYTQADAQYTLTASVRVTTPKELDLSAKHPAHSESCVTLQELSAPRMLLQTVARIYNAQQFLCNGLETIYSEAIPYAYSLTSEISLSGFGEDLVSRAYYRSAVSDYRGQIISQEQTETYENGLYTTIVGSGEPDENNYSSPETIRQQLEDKILSCLLAMKYLDGATSTRQDGTVHLELAGNKLFQKDMLQQLASNLQLEFKTVNIQSIGGKLSVDAETGLPIAMSLEFDLTHDKDGVPYRLTYQQNFTLSFSTEAL